VKSPICIENQQPKTDARQKQKKHVASIQKIMQQRKEEIKTLREAFDFVSNDKFRLKKWQNL